MRKVHRVIKYNQKDWFKPYIDMNTKLRQKTKNNFEKDSFKLMNNAVFGNTMENVRKYREMKLLTTEGRRKYLALESNYHNTKFSKRKLISNRNEKTQILMNKFV